MKIYVVLEDGTLVDTMEGVEDYDAALWPAIKDTIELGKRILKTRVDLTLSSAHLEGGQTEGVKKQKELK